jgi:hypothetical protein
MNQLEDIRERRAGLLARAALERAQISAQLEAWRAPLALLDKSLAAVRYVRRHPGWMIAAAMALAVLRPRRTFAWVRRGLIAWRAWRWAAGAARELAGRSST